jgi:oligopeptide transport system permease protein
MSKKFEQAAEGINDELFTFASYDDSAAERTGYSNYSYWRSTWSVFLKNRTAAFLLALIIILVGFTIIQPYLPGQKLPTKIYLNENTGIQLRNVKPSSQFWFGTNSIGQDLWSRIWSGTRTSLFIGMKGI